MAQNSGMPEGYSTDSIPGKRTFRLFKETMMPIDGLTFDTAEEAAAYARGYEDAREFYEEA